jgi:hypothetical protein
MTVAPLYGMLIRVLAATKIRDTMKGLNDPSSDGQADRPRWFSLRKEKSVSSGNERKQGRSNHV